MTILEGLNRAIETIEENLTGVIDMGALAKDAQCSVFHLQRMFAAIAGLPLSEYIRRRRLTHAALKLQKSGKSVTEIALSYGYASPDAFTRAFREMHGIPPSKVGHGTPLIAYPRLQFVLTLKGVVAMHYRIESKDGFRVVGFKQFMSTENEENKKAIPAMWEATLPEQFMALEALSDREPSGCLGICADMHDNGFDYWIAAATTKPCPDSLEELSIPASTWAIFTCVGPMPTAMQQMWGRIFSEWLPTSGYDHANSPEIEWYSMGDMSSEEYRSEIWIPVNKK